MNYPGFEHLVEVSQSIYMKMTYTDCIKIEYQLHHKMHNQTVKQLLMYKGTKASYC